MFNRILNIIISFLAPVTLLVVVLLSIVIGGIYTKNYFVNYERTYLVSYQMQAPGGGAIFSDREVIVRGYFKKFVTDDIRSILFTDARKSVTDIRALVIMGVFRIQK